MDLTEFDRILRTTAADHKLSGAESIALDDWIAKTAPSIRALAVLRHRAFEIAAEQWADPNGRSVLDWLESVLKRLAKQSDRLHTPGAKQKAYFSSTDDCPGRIAQLISQCRSSLDVCVFTITDDRISEPLLAAHRRNIPVRIITDDDKAADVGSDIRRFMAAGIQVRVDRTIRHMHHKFAIFDNRELLTGSYNWTKGAAENNLENFIVTDEPTLLDAFRREFERLWSDLE